MGSAGREVIREGLKVYAQLNEADSDSDELDECSAVEHDSGSRFCRFSNPVVRNIPEEWVCQTPVHGGWRDGTVRKVLINHHGRDGKIGKEMVEVSGSRESSRRLGDVLELDRRY
jgi:hypothetical protein